MINTERMSMESNASQTYVLVTFDNPNECDFYEEINNGFRTSFWTTEGSSTGIIFDDIPGNSLLPGQTKKVLVYTLNPDFSKSLIESEKTYWGPIYCAFGTLKLA